MTARKPKLPACPNGRGYRTEETAETAAENRRRFTVGREVRKYECGGCGSWHIVGPPPSGKAKPPLIKTS